jgi:hypothetical protein
MILSAKEIYDNPDKKILLDKIESCSPEIASIIATTGIREDVLSFIADNHIKYDYIIKDFLRENASVVWYQLYLDYINNGDAKGEIIEAFRNKIDAEYVKEYLPECSDIIEMEKRRSHFNEWKERQANQGTETVSHETSEHETSESDNNANKPEKTADNDNIDSSFTSDNKTEPVELIDNEKTPYITTFIEQLLGVEHDMSSDQDNIASDNELFQNLLSLVTDAINTNKERSATIINLRKALNTYKEYSASVEIQLKQLKSENEQLRYKYNNAVSQLDEYKKKNDVITQKFNEICKLQLSGANLLEG